MLRYRPTFRATAAATFAWLGTIALCLALVSTTSSVAVEDVANGGSAQDRPNILWIVADDLSPDLGCYGNDFTDTPHLDRFATESVLYQNAFATSPVCSPSRACLINGLYAPTQGTHEMRSTFPIPERMTGFPSFLRKAGYYTTNNVKTDYNSASWKQIIEASWDESSDRAHWRKREGDEPFFSIFNLMTTHQSRAMVWPRERFVQEVQSQLSPDEVHDPARVPVPPYYPDTPVVRRTLARYYDCITVMDRQVGALLKQLADDGLDDDTIVFFYSDHGSGLPRHKRLLLETGLRVPLLIRFPQKWRHLAPAASGAMTDRLVCFEDFGPTVLSLASVAIPDFMRGQPFLGASQTEPRRHVFGHRDRVDEVLDLARTVRGERYRYIRTYMPHLGYNQPSAWPDQGEVRHEFYRLADRRDELTDAQWHFVAPRRPVEELYDCQADPLNTENLVGAPEHREALERLRAALAEQLLASGDLGFVPEAELRRLTSAERTPLELDRGEDGIDLERRIAAASLVGIGTAKQFVRNLESGSSGVRYWGAVGLGALEERPSDAAIAALRDALEDVAPSVRIEAAGALARHGDLTRSIPVLEAALREEDLMVVLHAARTIQLLGEKATPALASMRATKRRLERMRPDDLPATVVTPGKLDMAMFIGFAIDAFLAKHGEESSASASETAWLDLTQGDRVKGWQPARGDGAIEIVDGEIRLLSRGKNLWLAHNRVLRDFELEAEAHMPDDAYNSGLAFRCTTEGKFTGYQCEIAGAKTGMIYAIGKGWVWPREKTGQTEFQRTTGKAFQPDTWNHFRVRCRDDRIEIWVNGTKTTDIRDPLFKKGGIAVQHHGRGGLHRFRNIRVRELEAE